MRIFRPASKPKVSTCPVNLPGHENGCTDARCRCQHRNVQPIQGSTDVWCNDCQDRLT